MGKTTIKKQHTASYAQLNELLSVAANSIKTRVANDISYKSMLQVVVMYLLPEWNVNTGGYSKGALVRCQGRVFESKGDNNTAPPFTPYEDGSGNILVDSHWNVIISDRVDTENWAHLQDTNPLSLPDQIAALNDVINKQNERIAKIETFLGSHTLFIE